MCSTYQVLISLFCDNALIFDTDAAPSRYINSWFYRHHAVFNVNLLTLIHRNKRINLIYFTIFFGQGQVNIVYNSQKLHCSSRFMIYNIKKTENIPPDIPCFHMFLITLFRTLSYVVVCFQHIHKCSGSHVHDDKAKSDRQTSGKKHQHFA